MIDDQINIFCTKIKEVFYPEHIIKDLQREFDNLEYGDVAEGRYQVWQYPEGVIFDIVPDRELSNDLYYSTPFASLGEIWKPLLWQTKIDKDLVDNAYRSLEH